MSTFRTLLAIPVALLGLASCGDDASNPSTDPITSQSTVTTADTATVPPASPVITGSVDTTPEPAVTAPEGPLQIDVLIGTDDGPQRIESVRLGSSVTLNITNPTSADEYHVHGYDFEQAVAAGVTATMNFVADQPGVFEVESHETGDVILTLQVG